MAALFQTATRRFTTAARPCFACAHAESLPLRASNVVDQLWLRPSHVETREFVAADDEAKFRVEQVVLDVAVDRDVLVCRVHLHADCLQAQPTWDSLQVYRLTDNVFL